MKVLITSATSAQAYKLKNTLTVDEILLGDQVDLPAFMRVIKLPLATSDTYAHEMLTLCLDQGIDAVYLLDPLEAKVLSLSKQLFKEYNIDLINADLNL